MDFFKSITVSSSAGFNINNYSSINNCFASLLPNLCEKQKIMNYSLNYTFEMKISKKF